MRTADPFWRAGLADALFVKVGLRDLWAVGSGECRNPALTGAAAIADTAARLDDADNAPIVAP